MVIKTTKITLSVKNATDIINKLKEIGAIEQELTIENEKIIINNICRIEL